MKARASFSDSFFLWILSSILLLLNSWGYSQETESTTILQGKFHRVVVADFENSQDIPEIQYLKQTIANALEVALASTNHFEMINRDSFVKQLQEAGIPAENLYNSDNITKIGDLVKVDVMVTGKFWKINNQLLIISKATSPIDQRVYVNHEELGEFEDYFHLIDELVSGMKDQMQEALPNIPIRKTMVKKETKNVMVDRIVEVYKQREIHLAERSYIAFLETRCNHQKKDRLSLGLGISGFFLPIAIGSFAITDQNDEDLKPEKMLPIASTAILLGLMGLPVSFGKTQFYKRFQSEYEQLKPQLRVKDEPSFSKSLAFQNRVLLEVDYIQHAYEKTKTARRRSVVTAIVASGTAMVITSVGNPIFLQKRNPEITKRDVLTNSFTPSLAMTLLGTGLTLNLIMHPSPDVQLVRQIRDDLRGREVETLGNESNLNLASYSKYHYLKARNYQHRATSIVTGIAFLSTSVPLWATGIANRVHYPSKPDGSMYLAVALPFTLSGLVGITGRNDSNEYLHAFGFYVTGSLFTFSTQFFNASTDQAAITSFTLIGSAFFGFGLLHSIYGYYPANAYAKIESKQISLEQAWTRYARHKKRIRITNGIIFSLLSTGSLVGGIVAGKTVNPNDPLATGGFVAGGASVSLISLSVALHHFLVRSEAEEFATFTQKIVDLENARYQMIHESKRVVWQPVLGWLPNQWLVGISGHF